LATKIIFYLTKVKTVIDFANIYSCRAIPLRVLQLQQTAGEWH